MSLLIKKARLRTGDIVNILIEDGFIKKIEKNSAETFMTDIDEIIDVKGSLVTESYISPHIHFDKVMIAEIIEPNKSGTLWEAIEKTWEIKKKYTINDIKKRASHCIDQQIKSGVTHIRTHVDVDSIGDLMPLKGLLAVKEAYKGIIDLEIVAFPQEGILKDEGTEERLYKALEMGASLVGGMPHNENTTDDSKKHIDILFRIAKEFNVDIDSHTDETDDPNSKTLQKVAAKAIKEEYTNRVTVDHICSLAAQNDYYAARVINLVKKANITVVTNPGTNMVLQGRLDSRAQRVGITRVKELLMAGVNITCGQDCINDPYYPFGKGDMLEVANLLGHAAKMTTDQEISTLYDMITYNPALMMKIKNYGIKINHPANLVILHGIKSDKEAIRLTPPARTTIKNGEVIAETKVEEKLFY